MDEQPATYQSTGHAHQRPDPFAVNHADLQVPKLRPRSKPTQSSPVTKTGDLLMVLALFTAVKPMALILLVSVTYFYVPPGYPPSCGTLAPYLFAKFALVGGIILGLADLIFAIALTRNHSWARPFILPVLILGLCCSLMLETGMYYAQTNDIQDDYRLIVPLLGGCCDLLPTLILSIATLVRLRRAGTHVAPVDQSDMYQADSQGGD